MTLRPIGWICGEMVRKFAGQAEMIQRAFLEIIDEIRDEFPNLLRLTSSNQQRDRTVKESGTVMGRVFSSPHGVIIRNGLTKISRSSKSIATFIQPQLAKKLAELNMLTRRLLNTLNGPKKPLLRVKNSTLFFYDIISYPAKTALTSVMCVSYATLIFLAISINKILGKIKSLVETQKPSRRNSSDNVDADGFPRGNETASVPIQQESSDFIMKAPKNGESIKTLLSSMDQEN
ncbi:spermatogenesis-associated protein 9 isoform X1 [Anolis carolinensis]|uniref:Spermatosis associated 9 n=1 Tax=Anolis carolinensis TaxID=28377 RepID=G1KN29_ANOCA|nr:PREDICTED: spermatogenesis-associated protein 9 [Anolis carolinensis]|eukprot:XP_003216417.1 PREDICTED: spermatogenesis-associated protein 9 [Anolis carolinensis]